MDHDEVLEQLELAAVEPDGLDAADGRRHAAGRGRRRVTWWAAMRAPRSSAGCGRAAPLLRDVVRTHAAAGPARADARLRADEAQRPSPARIGRRACDRRGRAASSTAPIGRHASGRAASAAVAADPALGREPSPRRSSCRSRRRRSSSPAGSTEQLAAQDRAIAGLEAVTRATIAITADADAQRVALAATDGAETPASLLFSPTTTKLVVVANGLDQPPAGSEYRCWVRSTATRRTSGGCSSRDDLAFWVGDTPGGQRSAGRARPSGCH